jgi:putative PIN family toxin of toxin-antitoxin system
MWRAVLDTDVLVAAVRSEGGAARRCIEAVFDGRVELVVSTPLVFEYEAVLTRPDHLVTAGLTVVEVGELLDALVRLGSPTRLAFAWRPMTRDPDDDMVLETAVNGGAEVLVTFNERDFSPAADRFGLRVMRPAAFLHLMGTDDA